MSYNEEQRDRDTASRNPILSGRPPELEDWLNSRIYHPLARRLASWLLPTPVTPNMVSVAGGVSVIVAAAVYASSSTALGYTIALLCHMVWHVLDGADGDLARLRGTTSASGEIIDGICDYAGHIILYLVLGWLLQEQIGAVAWLMVIAAGVARIGQANHYEVQRRSYQSWVYAATWLRDSQPADKQGKGLVESLSAAYLALASLLAPNAERIDESARLLEGKQRECFRAIIRAEYAAVLVRLTPLSANYRTIALGLSMIVAQSAFWFFLYEAIALTIVTAFSFIRVRRATDRILHRLRSSSLR